MSTKDNSNNKQNKGFLAVLVEKARKIFDTDDKKQEKSKKTNNIKKVASKSRSTSGKHSATKSTTASKSRSKTASKASTSTKKSTATKATKTSKTATSAAAVKATTKVNVEGKNKTSKIENNDNDEIMSKTTLSSLSVEKDDLTKKKIDKITEKENENEKELEKESLKSKSKSKEKIKEIEKTDSVKDNNNENRVKILEYYDLPFRYNKTVVKVLAQTPNRLFIYWDVSDEDKQALVDKFGPYFYNNTKPVLIVHNKTMNYSFEVDINDYANSWYLHVNDSKCDYDVELGRRSINKYAQTPSGYLEISHSNSVESPNDHILFDELGKSVVFENVKTTEKFEKDISSASFLRRLGELLNVKGLYGHLYEGEFINNNIDLNNPTS